LNRDGTLVRRWIAEQVRTRNPRQSEGDRESQHKNKDIAYPVQPVRLGTTSGTRTSSSPLSELGIPAESVEHAEPAPTNLSYTSYLLATVRGGSYAEGHRPILPCFWIYSQVDIELCAIGSPDPRFQRWHFRVTSHYELMFWQMGYIRESWPV